MSAFQMLLACALAYFAGSFYAATSAGKTEGYDTPRQEGRLTRLLMTTTFVVGLVFGSWLS